MLFVGHASDESKDRKANKSKANDEIKAQKTIFPVKIVSEEEKKGPKYHTLTGQIDVAKKEEPEEPEEPEVKVIGYSLVEIEKYFANFLEGIPSKSAKETKFRNIISKHFKDTGTMTAKSKTRTLGAFMDSKKKWTLEMGIEQLKNDAEFRDDYLGTFADYQSFMRLDSKEIKIFHRVYEKVKALKFKFNKEERFYFLNVLDYAFDPDYKKSHNSW